MTYRQIYEFMITCDVDDCMSTTSCKTLDICAHKHVPYGWRKDDDGTLWCTRHRP